MTAVRQYSGSKQTLDSSERVNMMKMGWIMVRRRSLWWYGLISFDGWSLENNFEMALRPTWDSEPTDQHRQIRRSSAATTSSTTRKYLRYPHLHLHPRSAFALEQEPKKIIC